MYHIETQQHLDITLFPVQSQLTWLCHLPHFNNQKQCPRIKVVPTSKPNRALE